MQNKYNYVSSVALSILLVLLESRSYAATTTGALGCLRFSNPNRHPSQFIINYCKRTVFLAVVEYVPETTQKHCAVYGLQGNKYAKRYAPGEFYERNTLNASYSADRALQYCRLSGFELTGDGLGDFVHFQKRKNKPK
ncbi:MAG: hypothetical protein P8L31_05740 [Pseudomonadales bacterium]|nr:hypothetical protein [Pseudomonadales bacterium]